MVSCYMPLMHSMVPTGVSWLSKWQAIQAFHTGVELRQGCVLIFLFFIVCMNWIDKILLNPPFTCNLSPKDFLRDFCFVKKITSCRS